MEPKGYVSLKIRKARISDLRFVQKFINDYAKKEEMLPRSLNELYETVRDFIVCEEQGTINGVCALHIMWEDLAEIRSLAVDKNHQKQGIGTPEGPERGLYAVLLVRRGRQADRPIEDKLAGKLSALLKQDFENVYWSGNEADPEQRKIFEAKSEQLCAREIRGESLGGRYGEFLPAPSDVLVFFHIVEYAQIWKDMKKYTNVALEANVYGWPDGNRLYRAESRVETEIGVEGITFDEASDRAVACLAGDIVSKYKKN